MSTATKELFIAYTGGAPAVVPKEYEISHLISMFHSYENNSDTNNTLEEFGSNVVDFVFLPSEKEQSTKRKQPLHIVIGLYLLMQLYWLS